MRQQPAGKTVAVEWTKDATGRIAMREVPGSERVWGPGRGSGSEDTAERTESLRR